MFLLLSVTKKFATEKENMNPDSAVEVLLILFAQLF